MSATSKKQESRELFMMPCKTTAQSKAVVAVLSPTFPQKADRLTLAKNKEY